MAQKYKVRVTKFIKEMAGEPTRVNDNMIIRLRRHSEHNSNMKGGRAMHFGAFRTDQERMESALSH